MSRYPRAPNRKPQLLVFCQTPRTMAQILSHFGGDVQWRYAVYNFIKTGDLKNLRPLAEAPHKVPGLFVAATVSGTVALPVEQPEAVRDAAFGALARAWFGEVRC